MISIVVPGASEGSVRMWKYTFVSLLLTIWPVFAFATLSCEQALSAIVVVGPYSGGLGVVEEAKTQGFLTIGVISDTPLSAFRSDPSNLDRTIVHDGSVPRTTGKIMGVGHTIKTVIAGAEWDPVLADQIRAELAQRGVQTRGNADRKSWSRRDKEQFFEHMRDARVPVPLQFASNDVDEIVGWYDRHGGGIRVLKPRRESGTTNVKFVSSEAQIRRAFEHIMTGEPNHDGLVEVGVVIQEKLLGTEYAFNGARTRPSGPRGRAVTRVSGIWQYERQERRGAATIYIADRLINPQDGVGQRLLYRGNQAMEATDLVYGPFHIELIDTPDRGPLVIDFAARPSGGGLLPLEKIATNRDPHKLIIASQITPSDLAKQPEMYERTRCAAVVFISTDGRARASHRLSPVLQDLKDRGLIFDYQFNFQEGAPLERTVDSETVVASVQIVADTELALERRIARIQELSRQKLFEQ